ncbi:MAG: four helix bundle protein [Verrucomicrobiota bacterium]
MKTDDKPPIHTATVECLGWTLDRTAGLPKSARFTFGQRLDNLTLDALMLVTRAVFSPRPHKAAHLRELNLLLEQLRVLWRLVEQRGWISRQQLLFVNGRLDEIGRMTGGWLQSLPRE